MIIQIDDIYFNPLMINTIWQVVNDVKVQFNLLDEVVTFRNWKVYDFAAEVNRLIKEFDSDETTVYTPNQSKS